MSAASILLQTPIHLGKMRLNLAILSVAGFKFDVLFILRVLCHAIDASIVANAWCSKNIVFHRGQQISKNIPSKFGGFP